MDSIGYSSIGSAGFYSEDHESFRTAVRDFIAQEVVQQYGKWKQEHSVGQNFWRQAATNNLLGLAIPVEFGGLGLEDYRYRLIMDEELARHHLWGASLSLHLVDDLMLPALLHGANEQQRKKWFPKIVAGEMVASTAMTEPGAGSDLRAISTFAGPYGNGWSITGQKTFIGMGRTSSWVLILAKTDKSRSDDSMSFFLLPKNSGITVGKPFDKMGFTASDTTELFFDQVQATQENLVGGVGAGFELARKALSQMRLGIACMACVMAEQSIADVIEYSKERPLFGRKLENFQNTHFETAELESQARAVRAFLEHTVVAFNDGSCSESDIAALKLYASKTACDIVDRCLQLFGGIGYILDSDIADTFLSARLLPLLGGTNEIMKTIVAHGLGLQRTQSETV